MIVLERQALPDHENKTPRTWAIFTAVIAGDGKTATGQLVNHGGNYGTMFMVKREALAHGTADDVVHHENSLRYHEACRKKSVETQLLLVKNGKHGPGKLDGKPSIRMASEEYVDSMLKWIEVTLKSQP